MSDGTSDEGSSKNSRQRAHIAAETSAQVSAPSRVRSRRNQTQTPQQRTVSFNDLPTYLKDNEFIGGGPSKNCTSFPIDMIVGLELLEIIWLHAINGASVPTSLPNLMRSLNPPLPTVHTYACSHAPSLCMTLPPSNPCHVHAEGSYRRSLPMRESIRSLFGIHNETGNIYSHLLGKCGHRGQVCRDTPPSLEEGQVDVTPPDEVRRACEGGVLAIIVKWGEDRCI